MVNARDLETPARDAGRNAKDPAAQTHDPFEVERRRLREAYARRAEQVDARRYSPFNPYALYTLQERERTLLGLLREAGIASLAELRILDVGCGTGGTVRRLLDYGAERRRVVGVDLLANHIRQAKATDSCLNYLCADAMALPFADETFDLVSQFTLFATVLDPDSRRAIAREMVRVLRPRGKIVWYDLIYNNPRNPDVAGIGKNEIRALFPGCRFRFRRITLAPPLGRALPASALLYNLLASLRLLCSHYLCLGEKL